MMSGPVPTRRLLIVSPHFPPLNAPDHQRVRMSLPHYAAGGWEPVVLCIARDRQSGVIEEELSATVPAGVRIITVNAFSPRWTRWLGVRNSGLRCWLPMLFAGLRLLRAERFDLVFFSTTQFFTFTLGRIWRRLRGAPYVFDMQDPWRTDYYERPGSRRPPGGWKYRFARLVAWTLEGWSFQRVSGVMSVSPDYISDLSARYPRLARVPSATIRFGACAEDLAAARRSTASLPGFTRAAGEVHLVYTGASGPVTPHALTVLFDAVRRFRAAHPERAARLRFHFFGTSYVAPGEGRPSVRPLAEELGVADLVHEVPHRLGHLECLRLQEEADVLLLPGSSDPAYSPSKTYPYFLTGRPILGLVFTGSVLEALLVELGGAHVVRFTEHGAKEDAHAAIGRFLEAALAGRAKELIAPRDEERFAREFLAPSLTARQTGLFSAAIAHRD
jgi:hypothetical protein